MPIQTDLNVTPYFDDYDEEKNFHRVLFRPSVPIQARELTQLQTILQNQIERFGEHVFHEGTIVKGCTFNNDLIEYAKLNDANTSGNVITVSTLSNTYIVTSANLIGQVENTKSGFESTNPDLNTLYFNYITTGNNSGTEVTNLSAGETIDVYDKATSINAVSLSSNTGTSYSNNDTITFSSTFGSNGTANLTTNSTGGIVGVSFNNTAAYGLNYRITDLPTVGAITTTTGSGANLELFTVTLTKKDIVTIANTSFEDAGGNTQFNPIGQAHRFQVGDGVIFQKGHFSRVSEQSIIVSDYETTANNRSVGFQTNETIANNTTDSSLNDNASGFSNENAPGAYRLKLEPTLVVNTTSNAESTNNFFIIAKFENQEMIKTQQQAKLSALGEKIANRTREESGDYITKPFPLITEAISGNTTHLNIAVGPGIGYVDGYRVENTGTERFSVEKATSTTTISDAIVSQAYGQYQEVDELVGTFDFTTGEKVYLLGTAGNRISTSVGGAGPTIPSSPSSNTTHFTGSSPSFTGEILGTAKIRAVVWERNNMGEAGARYRLYLFDIAMNAGKRYQDVRSIGALDSDIAAGAISGTGIADVVTTTDTKGNTIAQLKENTRKSLVFPVGAKGVKTHSIDGVSNNQFIFRTSKSVTVATNGSFDVALSSGSNETFPYTAATGLSETQEKDWIIVTGATAQTANLTGTVSVTSGEANVSGSSTEFAGEYRPGDYITVGNTTLMSRITQVVNNTLIVCANNFGASKSANTHARHLPANMAINLTDNTAANVVIGAGANNATVNLTRGKALTATVAATAYYPIKKASASPIGKTLQTSFVKIDCGNNAANTVGPWSLGIPDVYDIQGVFSGNGVYWDGTTAANTTILDKTESFGLDRNQKDGFYGLSRITVNRANTYTISTNDNIVVKFRHFAMDTSAGGKGFFNVDSYPISDTAANATNEFIKTEHIPIYSSPDGSVRDLRDCIDFRPYAANTADHAGTAASATLNPSATETISSTGLAFASPNKNFQFDYQYYLPRVDRMALNSKGNLEITSGTPHPINPKAPVENTDGLSLGTVMLPVYPTLSASEGTAAGRGDYTSKIIAKQQRGYTMKDIGQMAQRIDRLEYYSSLNLLEKATTDLTIPSEANNAVDRFKHGFLVDNFRTLNIAAVSDHDFKAGINKNDQRLVPLHVPTDIPLEVSTQSGTVVTGDLLTKTYTHEKISEQRFATTTRNAAQLFWQAEGEMEIHPAYDNHYATNVDPDGVAQIEIDIATPIKALANILNKSGVLAQRTSRDIDNAIIDQEVTRSFDNTWTTQSGRDLTDWAETTDVIRNTHQITSIESRNVIKQDDASKMQRVGEFVTDFAFRPYIREQVLSFYAHGLMPNRRHYVFFDEKDVGTVTRPANVAEGNDITEANFEPQGVLGANLVSTANGELFGMFNLAANTYHVGDRKLIVADQETFADIDENAMSKSIGTFNAYNYGVDKQTLTVATKSVIPRMERVSRTTTRIEHTITQRRRNRRITGQRRLRGDPLAQTFWASLGEVEAVQGCFLSKIDLFFKTKDPLLGITVDIVKVINGYPSDEVLPFSKSHKRAADVNTSDDGQTVTTFTFQSPVYVAAEQEYAIRIIPDQSNPNYDIYVAKTGQQDISTSRAVSKDSHDGSLFLSTNASTWEANLDEDLKFTLYRCEFSTGTGIATLKNPDLEFLSVNTINGAFKQGEYVYAVNASAQTTGTVTISTSNNIVTGTGTSFDTEYAAGQYITFANNTNQDVVQINSVTNSTSLILKGYPSISNTDGIAAYHTVTGKVHYFQNDTEANELIIKNPTSTNSTFKLSATMDVIGVESGANCNIVSVDNKEMSFFETLMSKITPSYTSLEMYVQANTASGTNGNTLFRTDERNYFGNVAIVHSKSNDLSKKMSTNFVLDTNNKHVSPVVDVKPISLLTYKNLINNSTTNEHLRGQGSSSAKYITKTVQLAEGLDGEDLRVYLTAYKPGKDNADIKVFGKFISDGDNENYIDKHWSELDIIGSDERSGADRNDLREYTYGIKTAPVSTFVVEGQTTDGSATVTTSSDKSSTLVAGTVVKIENGDAVTGYEVNRVKRVSGVTVTMENNVTFTNVGANIRTLDFPQTAFKDPQNSSIMTYYNSAGSRQTTFNLFAVKIILLSDDSTTVPEVKDMRAIALSV